MWCLECHSCVTRSASPPPSQPRHHCRPRFRDGDGRFSVRSVGQFHLPRDEVASPNQPMVHGNLLVQPHLQTILEPALQDGLEMCCVKWQVGLWSWVLLDFTNRVLGRMVWNTCLIHARPSRTRYWKSSHYYLHSLSMWSCVYLASPRVVGLERTRELTVNSRYQAKYAWKQRSKGQDHKEQELHHKALLWFWAWGVTSSRGTLFL